MSACAGRADAACAVARGVAEDAAGKREEAVRKRVEDFPCRACWIGAHRRSDRPERDGQKPFFLSPLKHSLYRRDRERRRRGPEDQRIWIGDKEDRSATR